MLLQRTNDLSLYSVHPQRAISDSMMIPILLLLLRLLGLVLKVRAVESCEVASCGGKYHDQQVERERVLGNVLVLRFVTPNVA